MGFFFRALVGPRRTAALSLVFCSGTLVCCALSALLVLLGAGSVLATLLSWAPGVVLLSEHKDVVFLLAVFALNAAGLSLLRSSRLPCSTDPRSAQRCRHRIRQARWLYLLSCVAFVVGGTDAYLPLLFGR